MCSLPTDLDSPPGSISDIVSSFKVVESLNMPSNEKKEKKSKQRRRKSSKRQQIGNPPEPGSVLDIIHKNSARRLYQPPILWTQQHLHFLGFRFSPATPPFPTGFTQITPASEKILREYMHHLTIPAIDKYKSALLGGLLKEYGAKEEA